MSDQYEQLMAGVRQKFIGRLPDYMADLAPLIDQVSQNQQPLSKQQISELREAIHGFAGAAGQVGLRDLRVVAKQIEANCLTLLNEEASNQQLEQDYIKDLFLILSQKSQALFSNMPS